MALNVIWGTDGNRVFTLEDGWVWIFTAIEHWNAECLGYSGQQKMDTRVKALRQHAFKVAHLGAGGIAFCMFYFCAGPYAALQPISMALAKHYGSIDRGTVRGLTLRMDHGTQYLSDHFLKQIKFWGVKPSFAFVAQPQTNGVAERFNRTMKEQAIYGRNFDTVEGARKAVRDFIELYKQVHKHSSLKFVTPSQRYYGYS